jgi:hypothetical protein
MSWYRVVSLNLGQIIVVIIIRGRYVIVVINGSFLNYNRLLGRYVNTAHRYINTQVN